MEAWRERGRREREDGEGSRLTLTNKQDTTISIDAIMCVW